MPEEGFPATPKEETLTLEETARLVRIAAALGIRKIRLTGGEPLLRNDLPLLVRQIAAMPGIEDVSCTTNGYLLAEKAQALVEAGLHRINVSLDTLQENKFAAIARRGNLQTVLNGISAAKQAGLTPLKINCVLMKGMNDDEVADFARWTLNEDVHVRFIELMPIRWDLDESMPALDPFEPHGGKGLLSLRQAPGHELNAADLRRRFVSAAQARSNSERELGPLEETQIQTNGPARTFRLKSAVGTVGFISQMSDHICSRCNRLRLTHDGFLRGCLMSDGELDVKPALRSSGSDFPLKQLFKTVVQQKPERHYLLEGQKVLGRGMSQTGG